MPYAIQRFEKEQTDIGGRMEDVFVAIIKKEGEEQPFRVVIEHIESKEVAMEEVARWIAAREVEDANTEVEKVRSEESAKKDEVLNSLNEGLSA